VSAKASTSTLNKVRLFSFLFFLQQAPIHSTRIVTLTTLEGIHTNQTTTLLAVSSTLTQQMFSHSQPLWIITTLALLQSTTLSRDREQQTGLQDKTKREGGRLVTWPRAVSYVRNDDHNSSQWFSHINFSCHHFTDKFYQEHRLFP